MGDLFKILWPEKTCTETLQVFKKEYILDDSFSTVQKNSRPPRPTTMQ